MTYQIKLKDLREQDGMYYIGDLVDIEGSGWVSKEFALQTIEMINAEVNKPIFTDFVDDLYTDDEF